MTTSSTCRSGTILTDTADLVRAALPKYGLQPSKALLPAPTDWILVSPSGSDDPLVGQGTAKRPYRTIGMAISKLQKPGQGVLVHPGTYTSPPLVTPLSGTANRPIWVKGIVDDSPIALLTGAQRVRLVGTGASGPCTKPPGPGQPVNIVTINRSFWILDGIEIDGGGGCYRAVSIGEPGGPPTEGVTLTDLDIHGVSSPHAVRVTNARDVVVTGCVIHDNWWAPGGQPEDCHGVNVLQNTDRIAIRNNVLSGHSGDSIQIAHTTEPHDPDPSTDPELPRNVTIEGNNCSGDFENAIDIKSCRNVTVVGNTLHDYLPSPQHAVGSTPVVIHYDARGIVFEQNTIRNCGRAISIADLGTPANPQRRMGPIVIRGNMISAVRVVTGVGGTGTGIGIDQVAGTDAGGQTAPHAAEVHDNGFVDIDRAAILIGGDGNAPRVVAPLVANNVFDTTAVCININPAAISERDPSDPTCQQRIALRCALTSDHNEFRNLAPQPFRRLGDPITFQQWTDCYDKNSCVQP